MQSNAAYDLKSVKLPYLSGAVLKLFVNMLEGTLGRLLIPSLLKNAGVTKLRQLHFEETPTNFPIHFTGILSTETAAVPESEWPKECKSGPGFQFASAWDYTEAYKNGKTSPEEVVKKIVTVIKSSDARNLPLRTFISIKSEEVMKLAQESAQRYKEERVLGPLDGVPVAVKDEVVTVDGNHPLAGVTLNFSVEIKDVRDATEEELEHGHAHGEGGHHH